MNWTRTIVCDVDDTICFTKDKDYANSEPIIAMIEKMNYMYDLGYDIIYFTARGQVTYNKNVGDIKKYREPVLIKWMQKHNVKYTELLFNKPYGIMYIDDKSVRPDEFLDMKVEVLYGRSNAVVERVGNRIKKYDFDDMEKIQSQYNWYMECPDFVNIPNNIGYKSGIISMDYISGISLNGVINLDLLDKLLNIVEKFSDIEQSYGFSSYIERIEQHISVSNIPGSYSMVKLLESNQDFFDKHKSFCHGDLILNNIVFSDKEEIVLIDSNSPANVYRSWLIDISKLYQSLHYDYEYLFFRQPVNLNKRALYEYLQERYSIYHRYIVLLELTQYIRMLKYREDEKPTVLSIIKNLWEEVQRLF